MSVAVLVVLAGLVAAGAVLTPRSDTRRSGLSAVLLVVGLGVAAGLALRAGRVGDWVETGGVLLAVAAAALGGGPVATAVLRAADPDRGPSRRRASDPEVLRGGTWIGVLERTAIAVTVLAGFEEGLAVLIAVKGLGRFNELKAPVASERFIIGTLASGLWALGCVGVAVLLRS
ncbi:hypothetical protein [Modestobacter versicolor]|uniref:Uncharacterized protein n=1 Tax=Modestobacter versicolor TaxID=429133 RepID=A0A323VIU4_9ACTN|nr:hypothetical protein [Modestobacter versicolor]MBB3674900.1 hypothetical protein [Modestobacter versicolor]PZA22936.1 hypothetical protein DMO24_02645 [Modestobacter versicolor]